jgi:Asp-tRNA(Asn)/Glu-tRNA(Gln) amidotransferase A subunit family amidase
VTDTNRDICFVPASELVRLYRARKTSPLEVMQAVLARIDAVNPAVNAYVTVARESALAAARRATQALGRKGAPLPALHGVPVSIKDLTATKGIRTTWGSQAYRDHVPDKDDLVVERLKAAGAIVVGKTNTPEFGAGGNTFNALFGATRNPWNTALTCGGSSGGGAVAVACGMGPIAQGTDLGGSVRVPASFCGVLGFRPTPGLVPAYPRTLAWDTLRPRAAGTHGRRRRAHAVGDSRFRRSRANLVRNRHAAVRSRREGALNQGLADRLGPGSPRAPSRRRGGRGGGPECDSRIPEPRSKGRNGQSRFSR